MCYINILYLHGFFYGLGKKPQPLESCLIRDEAQASHKLHRMFLDTFLRLVIPAEKEGECLDCIFKMRPNKRIARRKEILGIRVDKNRFK